MRQPLLGLRRRATLSVGAAACAALAAALLSWLAPASPEARVGGALAAAVAVACAAAAAWIDRRFRRELGRLVAGARALARGDRVWRADLRTGDELERVAEALTALGEALGRREDELGEARETLRTVVDGISCPIRYISRDLSLLFANRFHGPISTDPARFIGRSCHAEFWGRAAPCPGCPALRALATGRKETAEFESPGPDGRPRSLEVDVDPVLGPAGEVTGFIEFVKDVTERKRAEHEVARYARGLEALVGDRTRELRDAQAQVAHQEKMASLGHLAAGVAHEVGNPLAAISSLVQGLARRTTDEAVRLKLRQADEHVERITRIIRRMMDFARPPSGAARPCDAGDLARRAVEIAACVRRRAEIECRFELDPAAPRLVLPEDALLQVFVNIALNALDAMDGRGGTLTISTRRAGARLLVRFADTGTGMTEEVRRHVFEPFFTTKGVGSGTGLGLSVSYGLVRSLGGEIVVETACGAGSTFTVALPLDGASGAPPARPAGLEREPCVVAS